VYRPRTQPTRKAAFILLALVRAAPLLAGPPKEVAVRWEELAPLVEKREIETVLANGVHIRGRVEQVLPEALVVEVKRTSDPNLVPKGPTRVEREAVRWLQARWSRGAARAVLTPLVGLVLLPIALLRTGAVDDDKLTPGQIILLYAAGGTSGYLLGWRIDQRRLLIKVIEASPETSPDNQE
jgi:hypothetical protein